jgi:hypothetical protein
MAALPELQELPATTFAGRDATGPAAKEVRPSSYTLEAPAYPDRLLERLRIVPRSSGRLACGSAAGRREEGGIACHSP